MAENQVLATEGPTATTDDDSIYIDLDALLDTVMGTLGKIDPEIAAENLRSGKYSTRMVDKFIGVSKEDFDAAYAARDMETLKNSVLTNAVFFIQRLIKDSLLAAAVQSKVENICFTLNVYPYPADDQAFIDMLVACLRFHTYSTATVRVISMSNEELTPRHCVNTYQIMIRYDWLRWLNAHKPFFEKEGVPSLTLVVPEIFVDKVPTKEDLTLLGLQGTNPFQETTKATAPLFRLKFMPVSMFSINEKITAQNAAQVVAVMSVTENDIVDHLNKSSPRATLIRDDPLPVVNLDDAFDLF